MKDKTIDESMDSNEKKQFQEKLRSGKIEFKYKKKDGSERKAIGTMNPELMDLPKKLEDKSQNDVNKAETKKTRKLPEDSVFYYDLEAKGFRSFKMDNFIGYI